MVDPSRVLNIIGKEAKRRSARQHSSTYVEKDIGGFQNSIGQKEAAAKAIVGLQLEPGGCGAAPRDLDVGACD